MHKPSPRYYRKYDTFRGEGAAPTEAFPLSLFIGIDLGTSGCRAIAIDDHGRIHHQANTPLLAPHSLHAKIEQDPELWWHAVMDVLTTVLQGVEASSVTSIAIDGTSGTTLLADAKGQPLTAALMYNDARATTEAEHIAHHAPRESAAHGTSSGLAKLLWLLKHEGLLEHNGEKHAVRVHSQADWICGRLTGCFGVSDTNNMLKLGYDPISGRWPSWLQALGVPERLLPEVVESGSPIGPVRAELCIELGLPESVMVMAGTTDSTAAFIATGASERGEAVTSLGSTIVTKVIADKPVFAPEYGVYSQPLGEQWLVGGGSNSGGAVLRHYFSDIQMQQMTPQLLPETSTGLDYYPLWSKGERFPINDPELEPRMTPRPGTDVEFFQAMLEGMACIEHQAYLRLAELGAPYPRCVYTAGGGATNEPWTRIRGQQLAVAMLKPAQTDAAYGAALLARKHFIPTTQ